MKTYKVQYQRTNSSAITATTVRASSASQARGQIKARYRGAVKIISVVER